ncbi:MAG TPA: phosphoribosylformylglycinamidine cyclo-ligase, partial [Burkholderiales bacterium]|nr:phosphoribosylformylglycinamidine cyclo-ligase [Burkholderiales bacterium]
YPVGEYDLAGFAVGVVEKSKIITGETIKPGDVVLGLASNGAHSNGYSLIRKIVGDVKPSGDLSDTLMEPTRIYVKPLLKLMAALPVKGLAHITGGGLTGNVPRMLPHGTRAAISVKSWPRPELFSWLQREGKVAEDEMHRVFNCGIGMVIALGKVDAERAAELLRAEGELVYEIGAVEYSPSGEPVALVA